MSNPLALIVEIEIKKKQQANKDHQKTTKDKHQRLPKHHYRSFATTTDMEEDRNAESKRTLDVGCITKAIRFQTVKL